MAEIFRDAMDDLANWPNISGAGSLSLQTGRNGNGIRPSSTAKGCRALPPWAQADTITMGFAVNLSAFTVEQPLVEFRSDTANGTSLGTLHNHIAVGADGSMVFKRNNNVAIATSAAGAFPSTGVWHYVEVRGTLHDTAGIAVIRVNGVEVLNATGLDTKEGGTKTVYDALVLAATTFGNRTFDDVYARNDATFIGDPGSVVSTIPGAQLARQQVRAAVSRFGAEGVLSARTTMRVAVAPAPANTVVLARDQLRVAVGAPPADTIISVAHQMRVAIQDTTAKVRIGSVLAGVVASVP